MQLVGKIIGINTSDGMLNLALETAEKETFNLKISAEAGKDIKIFDVYEFDLELDNKDGRIHYNVLDYKNVREFDYDSKVKNMRTFFNSSPISHEDSLKEINKYINAIGNKHLFDIVNKVFDKYKEDFFLYPAATKMHHNYVGGLAYHVIGMLHLADGFLDTYSYLNRNYVYAGIILHDISKVKELTDPVTPSYSTEGQLIGHLVMGAMEIKSAAIELGIENSEEALVLEHMLLSHHGIPQYGAAKKPMVAEAMLLWYIDTIDSKFRVLEEELTHIESTEFTQPIGVLDKTKIYKI